MGIAITNFRKSFYEILAMGIKNSGIGSAAILAPMCSFCVYFCIALLL
jgi:hypothetical protein